MERLFLQQIIGWLFFVCCIGIGPILGGMIKSSIEVQANKTLDTIQATVDGKNSSVYWIFHL